MDGNAVKDEDDIENVEMAQIVQKENTIFSGNAKQKRENGAEPYILHRNAVSVLSSKCYDYSIVAIHHAIRSYALSKNDSRTGENVKIKLKDENENAKVEFRNRKQIHRTGSLHRIKSAANYFFLERRLRDRKGEVSSLFKEKAGRYVPR